MHHNDITQQGGRKEIMRFNPIPGLGMNPNPKGLYVWYWDHLDEVKAAAPTWQPIATAPKDELILVGPTKRMGICVAMNHSRDGWVTETCSEWANIYTPTHWMPLPKPPEDKQ